MHSTIAFETSIAELLRTGIRVWHRTPGFAQRAALAAWRQHRAARVRTRSLARGRHVPPFVIYSITDRCNLDCQGCYAKLLHTSDRSELTHEQAARVLDEARDLGVSVILLAGGEPLIPRVLELTAGTPADPVPAVHQRLTCR